MAKTPSPSKKGLSLEEEESGWTSYFEDYFASNSNSSSCFSLCGGCGDGSTPSLISDAASCAACKLSHHHNHHLLPSVLSSDNNRRFPENLPYRKLRFNKSPQPNHHQISKDDPLEDTASSPLNSPKDGDFYPAEMISRKTSDSIVKGEGLKSEHISDSKRDEVDQSKDEKITKGKSNTNYTDMKKRGLTLFPLTMLANYFG